MKRFFSSACSRAHCSLSTSGSLAIPANNSCRSLFVSRRGFFDNPFKRSTPKVTLNDTMYDKQHSRYTGHMLGVKTDDWVFYSKLGAAGLTVFGALYFVAKGYSWLTHFSMAAIARFGFMSGFATCALLYSSALLIQRKMYINANAVYNQSIAMILKHPTVSEMLSTHPRTGEFRAYCATGGFKLPLLRRVRSGSYELGDLLGTKPRRLQMMFLLKNPINGKEGLVTCDVWKEKTGILSSTNTFRSLAVVISDGTGSNSAKDATTVIVVGTEGDLVMRNFVKMH